MNLLDALASLGSATTSLWASTLLWTLFALAAAAAISAVPKRMVTFHHDTRLALLIALPASLILGALSVLRAPAWIPSIVLPEVIVGRGSASAPAIDVVTSPGMIALGLLTIIAAAIALGLGTRFLADFIALRRLLSRSEDVPDANVRALFSSVVADLGLPASPRLRQSAETAVPFVSGVTRPLVVLPVEKPADPALLRMIFLHECAHLARNDQFLAPLTRAIRVLFGFHPLVARLSRSLEFFREAACDGFVVYRSKENLKSYAHLLFSIAQGRILQPIPALSIHAHPSQLKQRIQAMSHAEPTNTRSLGRLVALALLISSTVFAACSDPASTISAADTSDELSAEPNARVQTGDRAVFMVVETMPQINGGVAAVANAITYPDEAKKAGVEGKVFISFVVDRDGFVRDATVERSVHPSLDAEALRVVGDLTFEPGLQRGKAVDVKLTLPITFRLQ